MNIDPNTCYRALQSRDARFDGRFFIAVLSTGIYCRPICSARMPLRKNIRFYPCAAAAEEAGFRPCYRCRPETAPGSPAWVGTSATVSRGLRLISEGALDTGSVDDLALRLGVGSRHLRRLFMEHLGATPIAVAQTRRVHFARKLIDETDLSIADIAFSAGYSSIRRFNAAVKKSFHKTPSEMRRTARGKQKASETAGIQLRLSYRSPLDWQSLLDFMRLRATPGVETVDENSYRRTIRIDGASGMIIVEPATDRDELLLTVRLPEPRGLIKITERVRSLFDLSADPREIQLQLDQDRRISRAIKAHPGLRVPGTWDGFELAVRTILGQQVSVKGATTLAGRLAEKFGEPLSLSEHENLSRLFPRPEVLADADLAGIGLTAARIEAIRQLATAVRDGTIQLDSSTDPIQTREKLCEIPGIGSWTAEYISMRALRDPDAFPAGDLALRRGASSNGKTLSVGELEVISENWRPWRAYAAMSLWRTYSTVASKTKQRNKSRQTVGA